MDNARLEGAPAPTNAQRPHATSHPEATATSSLEHRRIGWTAAALRDPTPGNEFTVIRAGATSQAGCHPNVDKIMSRHHSAIHRSRAKVAGV